MTHDINLELKTQIAALSDEFAALICKRLGIVMRLQHSEMNRTLVNACLQYHLSPAECLMQLKICKDDDPLLDFLISGITVGETYFFRDKTQMKLLAETILPELIAKKRKVGDLSLRIWSAGCSSGEELYTIGMILNELLKDRAKWNINLLGTDINSKVLQKAIRGCYSEWSMRSISAAYKEKYFTVQNKEYLLSTELRSSTYFTYLNLNENCYPSMFNGTCAQDLILCRNVLIYFDNHLVKAVMHKFYDCIIPEGYLLLGASDPIDMIGTHFKFQYQKGTLFSKPAVPPVEVKPRAQIRQTLRPISILKSKIETLRPVALTGSSNLKGELQKLIDAQAWEQILHQIAILELKPISHAWVYNAKALAGANMGHLELALEACEASLKIDPTDKNTYFTQALSLIGLNRFEDAEFALRKTLFLDRQFVSGHFQLGMLLLRNQKPVLGIKALQNALKIAQQLDPKDLVPGSQGINYEKLALTLKHEIELYQNQRSYAHENFK